MGIEYKIACAVPTDYDASRLFERLPNPIERRAMAEIYDYKLRKCSVRTECE